MDSLFETLAQATKPYCGINGTCVKETQNCKECCRIENQSNDDDYEDGELAEFLVTGFNN